MIHNFLVKLWSWLNLPSWLQWKLVSLWTPKFRVAVAGILLNKERQILLCEHTYRKEYPWGLPGGSLKSRENPDSAIKREVFEETGLQIQIIRPLMALSLQEHLQISIIYLCIPNNGLFQPNAEVSRIRYFALNDLPDRLLPSEREIIQKAFLILDAEGSARKG